MGLSASTIVNRLSLSQANPLPQAAAIHIKAPEGAFFVLHCPVLPKSYDAALTGAVVTRGSGFIRKHRSESTIAFAGEPASTGWAVTSLDKFEAKEKGHLIRDALFTWWVV